jgi:hypothetical protein
LILDITDDTKRSSLISYIILYGATVVNNYNRCSRSLILDDLDGTAKLAVPSESSLIIQLSAPVIEDII